MDKPFSQACENNKQPILDVLKQHFATATSILEIGSGTGQHAVHFAAGLPHVEWHTSDQPQYHAGVQAWLLDANLENTTDPVPFTVGQDDWPNGRFDGVFTANTTHIMQPNIAQEMMRLVGTHLPEGGVFCQYGPFKIEGEFTSRSNAEFHQHLLAQGYGGIQDIETLMNWAPSLVLQHRVDMPANNMTLVWRKTA
ncbi:class I SAM-dependent methyltransferase [Aestuariibacter sp. AA17]|uniref:Class I SAM-dependent methyltransferase n=1 Tax=Fluctibacter corallii TaxID=2984329 RepID=A0ABT3A3F3_9ALTE|nr:class I SAM-dependent methyltransferase [Aestuariibacter sp. AA17]MCV2883174.1 class I SAM-dependent methyltransferase [Aestuariibacter sp. AA17]